MQKHQIKNHLEDFFSAYQAIQVSTELLSKTLGFSLESDFGAALNHFESCYAKLLSDAIGIDSGEWIDWYIHENKCGANANEIEFNGEIRQIKCVNDLMRAMTANLHGENE